MCNKYSQSRLIKRYIKYVWASEVQTERLAAVLPPFVVLGFWKPNGSNADNNAASHTLFQNAHLFLPSLMYQWRHRLSNPDASSSLRFSRQGHYGLLFKIGYDSSIMGEQDLVPHILGSSWSHVIHNWSSSTHVRHASSPPPTIISNMTASPAPRVNEKRARCNSEGSSSV